MKLSEHLQYVYDTLKLHAVAELEDEKYFPGITSTNTKVRNKANSKYNKCTASKEADELMLMIQALQHREYCIGLNFVINDIGVDNITNVLKEYYAKYAEVQKKILSIKNNQPLYAYYSNVLTLKKNDFIKLLLSDLDERALSCNFSYDKKLVTTQFKS